MSKSEAPNTVRRRYIAATDRQTFAFTTHDVFLWQLSAQSNVSYKLINYNAWLQLPLGRVVLLRFIEVTQSNCHNASMSDKKFQTSSQTKPPLGSRVAVHYTHNYMHYNVRG